MRKVAKVSVNAMQVMHMHRRETRPGGQLSCLKGIAGLSDSGSAQRGTQLDTSIT